MSIFTQSSTVAHELKNLVRKAPAGGVFHDVELSPTVESHGLIYGPSRFYIKLNGRTLEVSVQDVSSERP